MNALLIKLIIATALAAALSGCISQTGMTAECHFDLMQRQQTISDQDLNQLAIEAAHAIRQLQAENQALLEALQAKARGDQG